MGLPVIDAPVYKLTLPSSRKDIDYRPFLVKEEKVLLMAMSSDDEKEKITAIMQVINNCTFDKFEIEEMPIIDIEYIFLHLRMKSKGDIAEFSFRCQNIIEDKDDPEKKDKCDHINDMGIDLNKVEVINKDVDPVIKLTDSIGVEMRLPNYELAEKLNGISDTDIDGMFGIIVDTIKYTYDGDDVTDMSTVDRKDAIAWIETLTKEQFEKIQNYYANLPKLSMSVQFVCESCGYKDDILIEGLESFLV